MQQNVKTRFKARWVFSRVWKEGGHGVELVTGLERVEAFRERVGGSLGFGVRFCFVPPS